LLEISFFYWVEVLSGARTTRGSRTLGTGRWLQGPVDPIHLESDPEALLGLAWMPVLLAEPTFFHVRHVAGFHLRLTPKAFDGLAHIVSPFLNCSHFWICRIPSAYIVSCTAEVRGLWTRDGGPSSFSVHVAGHLEVSPKVEEEGNGTDGAGKVVADGEFNFILPGG